jgi:hypothetical protein
MKIKVVMVKVIKCSVWKKEREKQKAQGKGISDRRFLFGDRDT